MKANEAPEKLYFTSNENGTHYYTEDIPFEREYIEYAKTDTFIERVFEFFGEHLWEYIDVKNANCDTSVNIYVDKFEEDFKNYIKGE